MLPIIPARIGSRARRASSDRSVRLSPAPPAHSFSIMSLTTHASLISSRSTQARSEQGRADGRARLQGGRTDDRRCRASPEGGRGAGSAGGGTSRGRRGRCRCASSTRREWARVIDSERVETTHRCMNVHSHRRSGFGSSDISTGSESRRRRTLDATSHTDSSSISGGGGAGGRRITGDGRGAHQGNDRPGACDQDAEAGAYMRALNALCMHECASRNTSTNPSSHLSVGSGTGDAPQGAEQDGAGARRAGPHRDGGDTGQDPHGPQARTLYTCMARQDVWPTCRLANDTPI